MRRLPIIIPGKGRIPRLGSIGPKLTPTDVTLDTLEAIVRAPFTPGAAYQSPETNETITLNRGNYGTIFEKYARDPADVPAKPTPVVSPVIDDPDSKTPINADPPAAPIVEPPAEPQPAVVEQERSPIPEIIPGLSGIAGDEEEPVAEVIPEPVAEAPVVVPADNNESDAVPEAPVDGPVTDTETTEVPEAQPEGNVETADTTAPAPKPAVDKKPASGENFKRFTKPDDTTTGTRKNR